MDKIEVYIKNKMIGNVVKENGEYIFTYGTTDTNSFLSLTMQVRQKPFILDRLHPIFEMHLPEGYLLSIIKKHFSKLTKTDDFGIFQLLASSIKGRITYKSGELSNQNILTLDDLLHPKSEQLFDELVSRFALNSSISGVQPKVLAPIKNKVTLKVDDYIVKSSGEDYPELTLNEYYCMKITKLAGIEVPEFYISDDEKIFIMKRFDKIDDQYIAFEDMCVLMGKKRDDKYEGSYEQIAKVIKTFVSPKNKQKSLYTFFKIILISYLVKNGDAHLKNFGIVYDSIENIKLAPAYDIVSTTVYIQNDIPALLLLGSKKWWKEKQLKRFGIEFCNLTNREVNDALKESLYAINIVKKEIEKRLSAEQNTQKSILLEKLQFILNEALEIAS